MHGTMRDGSRFVAIDVEDTGPGIEEEKLAKIFDPFFTTKATGEGTGLGLAVAQRIARAHGSELRVSSELGEGSTFSFSLPTEQSD